MNLDDNQKKCFYVLLGMFNIGFSLGLGESLEIILDSSFIARIIPLIIGIILSLWAIVLINRGLPIKKAIPYSFFQLIYLSVASYGMGYEDVYSSTENLELVKSFVIFSLVITIIFLLIVEIIIHHEKGKFKDADRQDYGIIISKLSQLGVIIFSVFLGYVILSVISKGFLFLEVKRYYGAMMSLFICLLSMTGIVQLMKLIIKKIKNVK